METEDAVVEEAVVVTGDTATDNNETLHEEPEGTVLAVAEQEGDKGDQGDQGDMQAGEEEQQVIEFVVDDSSAAVVAAPTAAEQEASSVTLLPMADGAKTIEAITTADGSIAYIQVESISNGDKKEDREVAAATVIIGDDAMAVLAHQEEEAAQQCVVQYNTPKMELLRKIWLDASSAGIMDYPVFCRDGVAFSNRLVLASVSPWIRSMLEDVECQTSKLLDKTTKLLDDWERDENSENSNKRDDLMRLMKEIGVGPDGSSCLVLPAVTHVEFTTFHNALFAAENDESLDFFTLIKVAEALGAELPLSVENDENEENEAPPTVDYSVLEENPAGRKRVMEALGYNHARDDSFGSKRMSGPSEKTLGVLSRVLHSEHPCDQCGRTFVDEAALQRHKKRIHLAMSVADYLRTDKTYTCDLCKKTFYYVVNLKKHHWLIHERPKKPVEVVESMGPLDPSTIRLKRKQEKREDMKCNLCGFEAKSWKQLQVHMMDHSALRPFKCETCGKGFKEQQKLRRHRVTHTGEKNHKCSFCGKGFGLRHNMRAHEKIHQGVGHVCGYCGKIYSQPGGLRDHEKQHEAHGHVQSEDERVRSRQKFEKARGRPSIQEMSYESVQREEDRRGQKKGFGEDTRKKMSSLGIGDAVEDEAGEGGDSSSSSSSKIPRKDDSDLEEAPKRSSRQKTKTVII